MMPRYVLYAKSCRVFPSFELINIADIKYYFQNKPSLRTRRALPITQSFVKTVVDDDNLCFTIFAFSHKNWNDTPSGKLTFRWPGR